ncbi:glycosyltransferase family 2 protein [Rivularia sp. UHCC 0363]|uniref:glycosyltransferase family 2 protein n=1 Tax=Rivularia sp. UHCC 0363 TaxID=3110244 RepID=UPI002B1FC14F|nr:glycosyltransferase family 2 protein [Rivularia sp. UHCC 0363]MEA5598358.1 glycosyltransferase family 2 protein [Rivularia sp. UHCC 0363]
MIINKQSSSLEESLIADNYPLVSILINNYNYAQYLSQAIDSALGQTYENTEVIVVDDGSTDNSREVIKGYDNQIISVFKKNGGQASAINAGFAASKGDIICLLDADDIFLPEKAAEIVNFFNLNPDIDWAFNESAPMQSEDIMNADLKATFKEIYNNNDDILTKKIDFRSNIINAELPNFTPSTSNLCFSRKLSKKMFPLPEERGCSGLAICDAYLKLIAVGLGIGCASKKNLGIFRLHQNNLYTTQDITNKRIIYSEIFLATAYYMRAEFPLFSKLAKKLFSKAFATYLRNKNKNEISNKLIQKYFDYLSFYEKIEVSCNICYFFLKLGFKDLV